MKTLLLLLLLSPLAQAWDLALPGHVDEFPRDHLVHPSFKTEWWYFTGHLRAADGRRFGYQVTFFRQGLNEQKPASNFGVRDLSFAHSAITDIEGKTFHFDQRLSRGSFGAAGFGGIERVAWIGDWTLKMNPAGAWEFQTSPSGQRLRLTATPIKPPVAHGENGVSQKAAGLGQASHYYSQTRLRTAGELVLDGKIIPVEGDSWFDHEWATNQLAANQAGWNWLGLHLDDGSELMLYQMRRSDGNVDPVSSGTFIPREGAAIHLRQEDFTLVPGKRIWTSPASQAAYPLDWQITIPSLQIVLSCRAQLEKQEMLLPPVTYWEGAVDLRGTRSGQPLTGHGYLELTGYGEALQALRSR